MTTVETKGARCRIETAKAPDGKFRMGYDFDVPGVSVGCGSMGAAPALDSHGYDTEAGAVRAGLEWGISFFAGRQEQGGSAVGAKARVMLREIQKLLPGPS